MKMLIYIKQNYIHLKNFIACLKPQQLLVLGFLSYLILGTIFVSFPFSQKVNVKLIDNIFNVTSAISTTGLTTNSVNDSYTFFGQLVFVILFQLGGIGYMTVSSFIIIASGKQLSKTRLGILKTEFTLPEGFDIKIFIKRVIIFSFTIELIGTLLLWYEFYSYGVRLPLWSAFFHCVSAFATAGFSLNNNSLEPFVNSYIVNITIAFLCYLGAIGFIVLQDFWLSFRNAKKHRVTLTSKIILFITALIFIVETPILFFCESTIHNFPVMKRLMAASFQVMTSSTTAGFNTIPVSNMTIASIFVLIIAMLIGASPSGTGGGIKTTTTSALYSILISISRGRTSVTFWGHEIPSIRLFTAVASATLYMTILGFGILILCLSQNFNFLEIFFEASSALGTVGLSMGITGNLDLLGKIVITALMFIGRVGPLTLSLSFFHQRSDENNIKKSDVAM